jgi:hypothetical protein
VTHAIHHDDYMHVAKHSNACFAHAASQMYTSAVSEAEIVTHLSTSSTSAKASHRMQGQSAVIVAHHDAAAAPGTINTACGISSSCHLLMLCVSCCAAMPLCQCIERSN